MEGRKSVGGKVEVKLRVRDPFKGRQVEENKEKWLVIDQFIHTASSTVGLISICFPVLFVVKDIAYDCFAPCPAIFSINGLPSQCCGHATHPQGLVAEVSVIVAALVRRIAFSSLL